MRFSEGLSIADPRHGKGVKCVFVGLDGGEGGRGPSSYELKDELAARDLQRKDWQQGMAAPAVARGDGACPPAQGGSG